jgi:hypothetical protein
MKHDFTYFCIAYDFSLQTDPLKSEACRRWTGVECQKIGNLESVIPVTL